MPRRYGYPRVEAPDTTTVQGVPYISMYNPQDYEDYSKILQNAQQRYDVGQAAIAQSLRDYSDAEVSKEYQPRLQEIVDAKYEDLNKLIQDKYSGDYGNAANEIVNQLALIRKPISGAVQASKAREEALKFYQQGVREGKINRQFSYDPITGKLSSRQMGFDEIVGGDDIFDKSGNFVGVPDYIGKFRGAIDDAKFVKENFSDALQKMTKGYKPGVVNDPKLGALLVQMKTQGISDEGVDKLLWDDKKTGKMSDIGKSYLNTYLQNNPFATDEFANVPQDKILGYIGDIIKSQTTKSTDSDYKQFDINKGKRGTGVINPFWGADQSKYEKVGYVGANMLENYGMRNYQEFKENAVKTNDPVMKNIVEQFENKIASKYKPYQDALKEVELSKKSAENYINSEYKKDKILSKMSFDEKQELINSLTRYNSGESNQLVTNVVSKYGYGDIHPLKRNEAYSKALRIVNAARDMIKKSESKHDESIKMLDREFANMSFDSPLYQAKIGEQDINKDVADYLSGSMFQLEPTEPEFRSGNKLDTEYGKFTKGAYNDLVDQIEKNYAGTDFAPGSQSKRASMIIKFKKPVKIDGEERRQLSLNLPDEPERRREMIQNFAIKAQTPKFAYQEMDGDLLNAANPQTGDIQVGNNAFLMKNPEGKYVVVVDNQIYEPTSSFSPAEAMDKFKFYAGHEDSFMSKYLRGMLDKYSSSKDKSEYYQQQMSQFGAFNKEE